MTFEDYEALLKQPEPAYHKTITAKALKILSEKWDTRVIFALSRHDWADASTIRSSIPVITNTSLATALQRLEENELVFTRKDPETGKTLYKLTQMGQELLPAYYELYKWARKWLV